MLVEKIGQSKVIAVNKIREFRWDISDEARRMNSRQKWLMLIKRIELISHLFIGAGGKALTFNDDFTGR